MGRSGLSSPTAYSTPPPVDDLRPILFVRGHAILNVAHELRVSSIQLVQSLAKLTDAKRAALTDWISDEGFRGRTGVRVALLIDGRKPRMLLVDCREQGC
jgi:hypothetical protein